VIIFGLGNPGFKYRWTRHNVGFIFLDHLAKKYKKRFHSFPDYSESLIAIGDKEIKLIKPLLYMNRSGAVVAKILSAVPEEFMVILDDINLPLGKLRFRVKGSDGGHLGLRSIIEALNTENFPRLRIGIGNEESFSRRIDATEFVLSPFMSDEKEILKKAIERGIDGLEIFITQGEEKAQNFINSQSLGNPQCPNREKENSSEESKFLTEESGFLHNL